MEYLEFFSEKRVFTSQDLFGYLERKKNVLKKKKSLDSLTKNTIQFYLEKGAIRRVKKNLYCAMSLEHGGVMPSKYEIASRITDNSFIGYHSAMEYYGYSNQVYNNVVVCCKDKKFNHFEFEHDRYQYKAAWTDQFVEERNRVRITSLERTIVDLIDGLETIDEYEELRNNLDLIPAIDGEKLLDVLRMRNKRILYNKVGMIVSDYVDDYLLMNEHIDMMRQNIAKGRKYLTGEIKRLKHYDSDWHLYRYELSNGG